jgi:hypothetical protein
VLLPVTATVAAAGLTGAAATAAVAGTGGLLLATGASAGALAGQTTTDEDLQKLRSLLAGDETEEVARADRREKSGGSVGRIGAQDRWCKTIAQREELNAPLRILVIDGGGIKGLVPAIILTKLEKLCWPHPLSEVFDLVAGTSTGGILALGTMMSNATPEEMAEVYETRARDIWTEQVGGSARKLLSTAKCEYFRRAVCNASVSDPGSRHCVHVVPQILL